MTDPDVSVDMATALAEHPFLSGMDEAFVRRLVPAAKSVKVPAGRFVLREGAEANAVYLLQQGEVALEIQVPGRGAVGVESLGPGDLLGLYWLFPPHRWVADARAVSAVIALALDASVLRKACEADPALGYAVTTRLLRQVYKRLERVRLQRLDVFGQTR